MTVPNSSISRRNFIKTGATTIAGLAVASNEMNGADIGLNVNYNRVSTFSDFIGMSRVVLDKNITNGVNLLTQTMINSANTIYVIQYDFELISDITIPDNCVLEFNGGTISGGKITGVVFNDVIKPEWFGAKNDGTTDCSEAVQNSLNVCKTGGCVLFSDGSYAIKHCVIRRNCEIVGKNATLVGQPYQDGISGFDYMFIAEGVDYVSFIGLTITGNTPIPQETPSIPSFPLIYVNNGKVAKFDSLFFDSIHTSNLAKWDVIQTDPVLLLASLDVDKTIITNCEFKDCWKGEWTWIYSKLKGREETEFIFSNNYIHDYSNGNTPLNAFVGNLIISNNLIENADYTGSLMNCHGYKTTIKDNIVRNCKATSVFDTCEYGKIYCDQVYVENNKVECLNALMLLTTAKVIIVKGNIFKGMSFLDTYAFLEFEKSPELRDSVPTNRLVAINENDIDCNYYDINKPPIAYTGQRCGIFIGEAYCKGDIVEIRGNNISCTFDEKIASARENRSVIRIANMNNITIESNHIKDLTPMQGSRIYKNVALIEQIRSVKVPYDSSFLKIQTISVNNNAIDDSQSGTKTIQIKTGHQYLDIDYATHDMKDLGFFTDENVGIRRLKSPIAHEFESAYETDCKSVSVIPAMSKGEIKTCDKKALLATSDTVLVNFDSIDNQGVSVRKNRVISFGVHNWQNLFSIESLLHISELTTSLCDVGDIAIVNGKAWRRCVDTRGAVIYLNNILV